MLHIVSTFDECGVCEYKTLLRSIRRNSNGMDIRIVGLYGEISDQSKNELCELIDDLRCFDTYKSYSYFKSTYGERLFHPLGKFAKLFFVREYLETVVKPTDLILFLDPDTVLQRPLKEFIKYVVPGTVMFGHEVQHIHHLHRDNNRLQVAEKFDKIGSWKSTYITEINTGVNLSIVSDFLALMNDFEEFVVSSEYLKSIDDIRDGAKWHDQDFFRYFYRKTMRLDIGCAELELIFTTTLGASKCLYYDVPAEVYKTNWDAVPFVVHFAGGTMAKIPRLKPMERIQPNPIPLSIDSKQTTSSSSDASPVETDTTGIPLEFSAEGFPYKRHAVFVAKGTRHLVERWLRKIPKGAQILLVIPTENTDEGRELFEKYHMKICNYAIVGNHSAAANKQLQEVLKSLQGFDSVMIPFTGRQVELQFQPNNFIPDLPPHYEMVRGLWKNGFRHFALYTLSGTKHLHFPNLLDNFVDKHINKRCFIVGNGPSLNDIDMSLLKDEITFGSNRCYMGYGKWGFDFTYWGIMDRLQVEEYGLEYEANIPEHTPKFFPFEYASMLNFANACPVPFDYEWRPPYRFSGSPDMLYLGFSVTHMMIQLAVIMGCNPIYLIGCDHRYDLTKESKEDKTAGTRGAKVWTAEDAKTPTHFTEEYTKGQEKKQFITPKPDNMERALEVAREWCDKQDIQILNATPNTNLKVFPLVDYATLFENEKVDTGVRLTKMPLHVHKPHPKWANFARDTSPEMKQRIASAERNEPLTKNDGEIAALKDIHKGKVGWLLGNGPSVRVEDLERLQEQVTFGCNRIYLAYDKMQFRPTYLCSTDEQMITDFGQEMIDMHPGKTLFVQPERPDLKGDFVWFRWGSSTPLQFSDNAYDFIMPGGGTLITAIQIGFHMGITQFYIYGMDHDFTYEENKDADHYQKASGDDNHFIENYRSGKDWAPPVLWQVEGALQSAQVFLEQYGGWIKNATRGGKLDVLQRISFDKLMEGK